MMLRTVPVILLLEVAALLAQDPVELLDARLLPTIEAKLASDRPADVAWGGYLAQRYRLSGATRAICEALQRFRSRDSIEARIVRLHLIDGLLGIEARVPAEQVEFLLDDVLTRAGAFAVMAADPQANREGLSRLALQPAEIGDRVRRAAGLLLATNELPEPRLGRLVVENLSCLFEIKVRDPNFEESTWNSSVAIDGFARKPERIGAPNGFPPLVRLDVVYSSRAGDLVRLLVTGQDLPYDVLLRRQERVTYEVNELDRGKIVTVPPTSDLLDLLRAMSTVKVSTYTEATYEWQDAAGFLAAFSMARDAQRSRMDRAVAKLRERGWLGKDDLPGFRIKLVERIDDARSDTSVPLPEVPAAPALGQ